MNEAELNHFDSIVGKQAKVAELQARVMGEYLWGVGTVLRFTSTPTHSRRLRRPPMTSAERVEKIADICATSVMVDVDLLREVSDIARAALEERDKLIFERADVTDWLNQELEQDRDVWEHLAQERKKERDGYKAQLVETLKAHNENGEVLARLQRRLDTAEGLINEIRPRPSNCHEYDDTCWACRARKWLEDKQDG